ncbi:MAG: diacylglycerol kinase family protein [Clostridia bacterium]|nr:diacylglycerol kinase family protein [Clostridia bacterium]
MSNRLLKSFKWAFKGLWNTIKTQLNMKIHLGVTFLVFIVGWVVGLSRMEWAIIGLAIALVLAAETFNTALEYLADALSPGFHPLIGQAKNAAAGAVLIAAILAALIGLLIFLPHL